jgi:hypothetical protein
MPRHFHKPDLTPPPGKTAGSLRRLNRSFPLGPLSARAVLLEIVRDDDTRWRPWIKTCAVHAASLMAPADETPRKLTLFVGAPNANGRLWRVFRTALRRRL